LANVDNAPLIVPCKLLASSVQNASNRARRTALLKLICSKRVKRCAAIASPLVLSVQTNPGKCSVVILKHNNFNKIPKAFGTCTTTRLMLRLATARGQINSSYSVPCTNQRSLTCSQTQQHQNCSDRHRSWSFCLFAQWGTVVAVYVEKYQDHRRYLSKWYNWPIAKQCKLTKKAISYVKPNWHLMRKPICPS